MFIQSSGQGWLTNENNIETNWNITFQVGPSVLLGELKKDFSGWSNDMNNVADFAFSLQMGKMVFERVDLGLEFGLLNLQGYRINPTNVHYLMRGGYFNNDSVDFQPFPLYYDSDITHLTLFAKYNFINFSSFTLGIIKLNLYAKMGIGIIWISAEMGYRDRANYQLTGLTHPIYSSGRKPRSTKNAHAIFSPAFGLNYQITERIFVSFDASFQFLSADYLDGVRNFSADLDPENTDYLPNKFRIPVYDVTGKFTLGVTYFFNFDTRKQVREKAMPWYFNRYRSYYSKYHQQSSRKARQERLPFFRDKFDDE
ncbi:MAG TPA: hypothetical protein PLK12_00025 [Prolixibacteraceae bacterium]|nr:hypothetical protein [Prolixibacteraceae bacterium]